jgi:hypothetical protein
MKLFDKTYTIGQVLSTPEEAHKLIRWMNTAHPLDQFYWNKDGNPRCARDYRDDYLPIKITTLPSREFNKPWRLISSTASLDYVFYFKKVGLKYPDILCWGNEVLVINAENSDGIICWQEITSNLVDKIARCRAVGGEIYVQD